MAQILETRTKQTTNDQLSLLSSLLRSKEQVYSGSNRPNKATPITAGTTISTGSGFVVQPGRRFIVKSIFLSMDGAGECRLTINGEQGGTGWQNWLGYTDPSQLYFTKNIALQCGASGGSQTYNFPDGLILPENSSVIQSYISQDTVAKWTSFVVEGYDMTEDAFPNAKFSIDVISDSTGWFPMGNDADGKAYLGKNLWNQRLRDQLRLDGYDVNLTNYGFGGARSVDAYYELEKGRFNNPFDLRIVSLGMNDCVTGSLIPEAKFKTALSGFILDRNRKRPGKPIILLGPSPTDNTQRAPNVATYRQYIKDVAQDATIGTNARNVWYYDQSLAFTLNAVPANDINISSAERVANGRLHPSGIGSGLIYSNTNNDPDNSISQGGVYPLVQKIIAANNPFR